MIAAASAAHRAGQAVRLAAPTEAINIQSWCCATFLRVLVGVSIPMGAIRVGGRNWNILGWTKKIIKIRTPLSSISVICWHLLESCENT